MAAAAALALAAFALVPLYDVLCTATGFNGKTAGQGPIRDGFGVGGLKTALAPPANVDVTRTITVEFTGTVMPGLPWDMRPLTFKLDAHPGELQQVTYLVRNTSNREITGQAVPSVTPGKAAQYFDKIECFCFTEQLLLPGQSVDMPVVFFVDPDMDKDRRYDNIRTITLSYTFFEAKTERARTLLGGVPGHDIGKGG